LRTLAANATFAREVKKSRFLARAGRVDSIDQAVAFIQQRSLADASHNCWAYQVDDAYRFSDDGEPASTAGRPIFSAIQGQELDHVVVLVTRYFGGTKLGAGGLVRAYGGCAAKCLSQSKVIEVLPRCRAMIEIEFDQLGAVYTVLDRFKAARLAEDYREGGVQLKIELQVSQLPALVEALSNATHGAARIKT
jgi:uncharacterized YigZ family protein